MPKIIGIVAKTFMRSQLNYRYWDELYVQQNIQRLLTARGATCIGLVPAVEYNRDSNIYSDVNKKLSDTETKDIRNQLDLCDGVILQGGLSQHKIEEYVAEYAIKKNIPILGICAGFDSIARAAGLSELMYDNSEDLNDIYIKHNVVANTNYRHDVFIQDDLLGTSRKSLSVNSMHTLMLSLPNLNLDKYRSLINIFAVSHDYISSLKTTLYHIEAFLIKNTKFALAIKWHPELMPDDHSTKTIFDMFISAV